VKRIPGLAAAYRSLQTHIRVAECVARATDARAFRTRWHAERTLLEGEPAFDVIDDLLATREPPFSLLRLACLASLTTGGLRAARHDALRRGVLQTYGFELLGTLYHLERVGLLARARDATAADLVLGGGGARTPFAALRRALRLVVADVDSRQPNDTAYATPRREASAVFTQVAFDWWSAPRAALPVPL